MRKQFPVILFLALSLSACSTGLSPAGQPLPADSQTEAVNPAMTTSDFGAEAGDIYRSLVIGDDFQTQGLIHGATRAVIVKIGPNDYVLSYRFMNKLRGLLADAAYNTGDTNEAVATPGFFTRLRAASGVTVAANVTTGESAYTSAYTLGPPEAAFVTRIEAFQAVSMPNFLQEDDTTAESTGSLSALGGSDGIRMIVNKTGIRRSFYQAVNYALGKSNDTASADLEVTGEHVLYDTYLNPSTTATAFSYSGVDATTTTPATRTAGTLNTVAGITTAERNFLASLGRAGLEIEDALLLNSAGQIVSGDIDLHFSENDLLNTGTPTLGSELMPNYSFVSRVNYENPITPDGSVTPKVAKAPTDPSPPPPPLPGATPPPPPPPNQVGAAAVLAASVLVDAANTATHISALADTNGYTYSPPSAAEMDLAAAMPVRVMHRAQRALHMYASGATEIGTSTAALSFTSLLTAPAALATPSIPQLTTDCTGLTAATCSKGEFSGSKNLFEAIQFMFQDGLAFKLGKNTATSNRNQPAIFRFFYADDPSNSASSWDAANVTHRALIVPAARSATGALSLSTAGPFYVVVTAAPLSGNGLSFYLSDPGARPSFMGESYRSLGSATTGLVSSLYNYGGVLVGVSGAGPDLP
ncbi:MAG: hypothetical protein ACAI44_16050 [Candidatus Sericytochromatia bacterium]